MTINGPNNDDKKDSPFGLVFIMIALIEIMFILFSVIVAIPTNPVSLSKGKEKLIRQFYPQGWGFYSKNPREAGLNVYNMNTDKQAARWPNNKVKNLFGLYRYGRAQGTEVGLLKSKVSNHQWSKCKKDPISCLSKMSKIPMRNSTPNPTLCGDIGLAIEKPVPWAWGKYSDDIHLSSKVARVSVKCSKN